MTDPKQLRQRRVRKMAGQPSLFDLRVTFDQVKGFAGFVWSQPGSKTLVAAGRVRCSGADQLTWELERDGQRDPAVSSHHRNSIRAVMNRWLKLFPANRGTFTAFWIQPQPGADKPLCKQEPPFGPDESAYGWLEDNLVAMAEALRFQFSPLGRVMDEMDAVARTEYEHYVHKLARKEQKRAEAENQRREAMARLAAERRRREERRAEAQTRTEMKKSAQAISGSKSQIPNLNFSPVAVRKDRPLLPPVPVRFETPPLAFQETAFPLMDLRGFFLRERAALWWVSNQSDDLLCLPHCRIERLEYQTRAALRVLGPLRGRALLSDEVGLGKTIEAGLVIKELLTRGMVKRFLVLTVPSLVDQWEEELSDKFGLTAATTNAAAARVGDPAKKFLARQRRHRRQPEHAQTTGAIASRTTGSMGHPGAWTRRTTCGTASRKPGRPSKCCRASFCSCSPPRRCKIRSMNFTTSSRCSSRTVATAQGISRPLSRPQTSAPAAPAGGTAPAARPSEI